MGTFGKMLLTVVVIALGAGAYYEFSGSFDGSSGGDANEKFANRTMALSLLRKYSVAQNMFQMQSDGRFAAKLDDLFKSGMLDDQKFYKAWAGQPKPEPISGYIFVEVVPNTPQAQCGLTAYPVEPGKTGDKMLVIFLDQTSGPAPTEEGPMAGDPNEIQIWEGDFTAESKPVTTWLTQEQRAAIMTRIDRPGLPNPADFK